MEIRLTKFDVAKILSRMGTEEMEEKLDSNYSYWLVSVDRTGSFILNEKIKSGD